VCELVGFGLLVTGSFGLGRFRPAQVSFVSFYAAGTLALAGKPELAYNDAARYRAEQTAIHKISIQNILFLYPPVYLLICAPLALLPYLSAFILFAITTLCLYLFVVRAILREHGWTWLVPVLAFPGVFWTLGFGQNSFLSAALFGAATLLIDTQPIAAGILFAALCYKPTFGLLIPVALIAGRHWTAFTAAVLSTALFIGLSVAVFGWETWHSYLQNLLQSGTYNPYHVQTLGSITFLSAALLLGLPVQASYLVQITAMLVGGALVVWSWWRNVSLPVRAAALIAGTLIAAPYALLYDMMLATISLAWLIRAGRVSGFLPYEGMLYLAIYIIPLITVVTTIKLHLSLAPLATATLVVICAARTYFESQSVPFTAFSAESESRG
jgi:hypothetical protein